MTILSDALFLASALIDECERNGITVDRAHVNVYNSIYDGGKRATISLYSTYGQAIAERLHLLLSEEFYCEGRKMRSARSRTGRWVVETTWPLGGAPR